MIEPVIASEPNVTIVVTQRERFSYTRESLESIYANTSVPFKLIYVDGNSPGRIKNYLEMESKKRGYHLIRTENYLTPSAARNLSLPVIDTEYVLFIDNDVIVSPGWLENLLESADKTSAWIVTPLYREGMPEDNIIHIAGGFIRIEERNGKRRLLEKHNLAHQPLEKHLSSLQPHYTELFEFHCVLMRTDIFDRIGGFDEMFMSTGEHWDVCLQVKEKGGSIYFDPRSLITYVPPASLNLSDMVYYNLRWSDRWNRVSIKHFQEKWNLSPDDPFLKNHYKWLMHHRQMPFKKIVRRFLPFKRGSWLFDNVLVPLENSMSELLKRASN